MKINLEVCELSLNICIIKLVTPKGKIETH